LAGVVIRIGEAADLDAAAERAQRLYERCGFRWTGREADDHGGERIVHCEREL